METRRIHSTTIDILLVEQPPYQGKTDEGILVEALGAGGAPPRGGGRSTHHLALGYRVALGCADEKSLESIAFQGIDAHICGCPVPEAAKTAVIAVHEYLDTHKQTRVRRILFLQYSQEAYDAFRKALRELPSPAE